MEKILLPNKNRKLCWHVNVYTANMYAHSVGNSIISLLFRKLYRRRRQHPIHIGKIKGIKVDRWNIVKFIFNIKF